MRTRCVSSARSRLATVPSVSTAPVRRARTAARPACGRPAARPMPPGGPDGAARRARPRMTVDGRRRRPTSRAAAGDDLSEGVPWRSHRRSGSAVPGTRRRRQSPVDRRRPAAAGSAAVTGAADRAARPDRRLRRADQAADHRAAADHHDPGDVRRPARRCRRSAWSLATLVGGTLAAGSANALNCVVDADIDAVMRRTRSRPLARHAVPPRGALIFGIVLGVLAAACCG